MNSGLAASRATKCAALILSIFLGLFVGYFPIVPAWAASDTAAAVRIPAKKGATSLPLVTNSARILGVEGSPGETYSFIPWRRVGHPSCGWGDLSGSNLKAAIDNYHRHGIRVLLTVCQPPNTASDLINVSMLRDAAQGGADAVQCGNEQMKLGKDVPFLYTQPAIFARFYDICERLVEEAHPGTPVLMGSLDPHVGGIDYGPLGQQVAYLNAMQAAMNTRVHPGGHWRWTDHAIGLIDTWHNGYPDGYTNSLYQLFLYWAQRFGVPLQGLGQHLWVVESTGCFKGCGIDSTSPREVAIVHTLSLITNVETARRYGVPHFFFSGRDFVSGGILWPLGVLTINGQPKPIRQDLRMGAIKFTMTCGNAHYIIQTQVELLATLYQGCSLPANYLTLLET